MTISHVTQSTSTDTPSPPSSVDSPPARPESNAQAVDRAQISASAQAAAKAAVGEATETKADTAKEARAGDRQAQQLMAKYAAAH